MPVWRLTVNKTKHRLIRARTLGNALDVARKLLSRVEPWQLP